MARAPGRSRKQAETVKAVLDLNVFGALICAREAVRRMSISLSSWARPKSASLGFSAWSRRMLLGFRSRCTIPRRCT